MTLFFLRALVRRQLLTTPKFEELIEQTGLDAERYRQVEKSAKLKEFRELEQKVTSHEFQANKKQIVGKKYKDTEEAKKLDKFSKLEKDKYVRLYLKTGEGEGRSAVHQYLDLKAEIETPEFKKQNDFWADPRRWESTEEGKFEARYLELSKDEDIVFFNKANLPTIETFERFEKVYDDDFTWSRMESSDWRPGYVYPSKDFVKEHSFTDEQQAYNHGHNVETNDSVLYIKTVKEPKEFPAWDATKGMVKKNFRYTSDIICNDKLAIEEGSVVQVKVRCRGLISHGIYLRSAKHVPYMSLFNYDGRKLYVGVRDSLKHDTDRKYLDGLQPIAYTVFTVSWQKDEIAWFVNNLEVFRTKNTVPKGEKLYLHMSSFLFDTDRLASEGELQVDWVRVYKLKK